MPQGDKIISFHDSLGARRPARLDARAQRVVAGCREHTLRVLPRLMGGLFEKLDDALYELADRSDVSATRSSYFDAMRALRKVRGRIEQEFSDALMQGYDLFWQFGPEGLASAAYRAPSEGSGELSLLDDAALEENLAVSGLVSKNSLRYSHELYALNARFSSLSQGAEVTEVVNPLGPTAFGHGFRHAIRFVALEIPVKLVVYKLFDRNVMHYVGGLYDDLNGFLVEAGVLPHLTPLVRRNPSVPHATGERARPAAAAAIPGEYRGRTLREYEDESGEVGAELFHNLQQLLDGRRGQLPEPGPGHTLIDTSRLFGALTSLQQSNVAMVPYAGDAGFAPADLRGLLAQQLSLATTGEKGNALKGADNDTIDVVSMLFEFILEDRTIPDALKALIGRLQIPMLKVALVDKAFFAKKLHPARRLLNNLSRAAVGWNDDGDRSPRSLYGTIESIVNRILTDYNDDVSLFAELNDEFTAFWEREREGARVVEERTTQVSRGKEQLQRAKKVVADEIRGRLAGRSELPEVVVNLIQDGWKDVLLLAYLRKGPDSDAWRDGLGLLDELLWSVEPKVAYEQRQELLRSIPELLKRLREGLGGISFDQHKMARLFKELQAAHIACLRGQPLPRPVAPAPLVEPREPKPPAATAADPADPHARGAERLAVGEWIELRDPQAEPQRAKLSWKSAVSDSYVFVNAKGLKVAELTRDGLARRLRQGSVRLLQEAQAPIMDRALQAMLEALKRTEDSTLK